MINDNPQAFALNDNPTEYLLQVEYKGCGSELCKPLENLHKEESWENGFGKCQLVLMLSLLPCHMDA
jgi:hypothetical protein